MLSPKKKDLSIIYPHGISLFKANDRNAKAMCEISLVGLRG